MSRLFTPLKVGRALLNHRIAMAPMTRLRADDNHEPLPFVTEYYEQRAALPGTLLVTEATVISERHGGYPNVPGIYTNAQVDAWKKVTDAVHAKGSHIFCQLWALGRTANPAFMQQSGHELVSASDVPMKSMFSDEMHYPTPLTEAGIHDAISDFTQAAQNAIRAGFDGVEIHGANGYLVDQFIQDVSNKRTDTWGGNIENRSRFAVEVTKAIIEAVGSDRTAIRLSPWSTYQGMRMENPIPQFSHLVKELAKLNLAYIHTIEPGQESENVNSRFLLDAYDGAGPVVICGNYNGESAQQAVDGKYKGSDVVIAFGRPYISNPDLAFKVQNGIPLDDANPATFYSQSPQGFTDYQFSKEFQAVKAAA